MIPSIQPGIPEKNHITKHFSISSYSWWFFANPFEKYDRQNGFIFPK